jgi:hypothetical protein
MRSLREITESEKLSLGCHRPSIVVSRLPTMARTKITGLQRRGWKYRPSENPGRLDTGPSRNFVRLMTQLVQLH